MVIRFAAVMQPALSCRDNDAVLFDASRLARVDDEWFEPSYWRSANKVVGEAAGRGAVIFVRQGDQTWVLRHYHRGGFVGRFVSDRFLWRGLERTRAFREWRLLSALGAKGLPVPRPIAARVRRTGVGYTADIITGYIENTRSFETMLEEGDAGIESWNLIGRTLRRFHDCGVDHNDLNVRNILFDASRRVYLIDFDKGELRESGSWRDSNLNRLKRSLQKVALETGTAFDVEGWTELERGYESGP